MLTFLSLLIPPTVICLISTLVTGYRSIALNDCDAKYGCIGGVQFSATLGFIAGLLSALVLGGIFLLFRNQNVPNKKLQYLLTSTLGSMILGLVFSSGNIVQFGLPGMLLIWFLACFLVYLALHQGVYCLWRNRYDRAGN